MIPKLALLVIEDNENDAILIRRKLESKFEIVIAGTKEEGLRLIEDGGKFDCVILDLTLTNGLKRTIYQEVRRKYHDGPIGIVTGDDDPRMRDYHILQKPGFFAVKGREDKAEDLIVMIRQAIQRWKKGTV